MTNSFKNIYFTNSDTLIEITFTSLSCGLLPEIQKSLLCNVDYKNLLDLLVTYWITIDKNSFQLVLFIFIIRKGFKITTSNARVITKTSYSIYSSFEFHRYLARVVVLHWFHRFFLPIDPISIHHHEEIPNRLDIKTSAFLCRPCRTISIRSRERRAIVLPPRHRHHGAQNCSRVCDSGAMPLREDKS